jgi:signal transduction histidine kinase
MRLTTKLYASILLVTCLALLSSVTGLFATWRMTILVREMIDDNLPSVREAEKLESNLLRQDEYDESYLLDGGNPQWLKDIAYRKGRFEDWLATAKTTTHSAAELDILRRLETAYRQFDGKRNEVIRLCDEGDTAKAKQVLLQELDPLSDHVNDVCQEFIDYVERYIDTSTARAARGTERLMWLVIGCAGLTAVSGVGLLWLFVYSVHVPLRKMVSDARQFADVTDAAPEDDFSAIGFYLRALMSDVTNVRSALMQSRRQTQSAEKLASVGRLAASVAHEIRNPLIAIRLWLTSIQKKRSADAELSRDLEMVGDEITRLDAIVRDFLEFSRPTPLAIEAVKLDALLDETLELLCPRCKENEIDLVREYRADLPPVMADRKQLKQTFINLLNNAAEAMPDGGKIRVVAEPAVESNGRLMTVVRLQDTGPGISEEIRQRLFEPFFTTKEGGTGLGLCIAAGIMTRHGGRLVLEPSDGRGASFAVWIPAAVERQE